MVPYWSVILMFVLALPFLVIGTNNCKLDVAISLFQSNETTKPTISDDQKKLEVLRRTERSLLNASANGSVDEVKGLLSSMAGGEINPMNENGETPLHLACKYGHLQVVSELIKVAFKKGGRDLMLQLINTKHSDTKWTAIFYAASSRAVKDNVMAQHLLELLVASGAELEERDVNGSTPFLVATKSSSIPFAKALHLRKANVLTVDGNNYTALHLANDPLTIDYVSSLKNGVFADLDRSTESEDALTPLHIAVLQRKPMALVDYLVAKRVNLNAVDPINRNIIHMSVQADNLAALDSFLKMDSASISKDLFHSRENRTERTPLLLAIELGRVEAAQKLVESEKHFTEEDLASELVPGVLNDTYLHAAVDSNHPSIVRALLSRYPSLLLRKNSRNQTPLHRAIVMGRSEIAIAMTNDSVGEDVLKKAAPITDMNGRTILHTLGMKCTPTVVEIGRNLAQHFSELQGAFDSVGDLPLDIALKRNCRELVELFLSNGMKCDLQNAQGETSLHLAKRLRLNSLVEAMVTNPSYNCSLDQTDSCGLSVREMTDLKRTSRCEPLPLIENGIVLGGSSLQCAGSKLQFACKSGYRLRGLDTLICGKEGKWTVNGHCEVTQCSEAPLIANGHVSSSTPSSPTGSKVTFTCNSRYAPRGSNVIKCVDNGRWEVTGYCEITEVVKQQATQELLETCSQGNTDKARALLQSENVDLNAKYDKKKHGKITGHVWPPGSTCLMLAAGTGKAETIGMLIREFRVDVGQHDDRYGWTALHYAAYNGHVEVVRLLRLEGRANAEVKDSMFGWTALMMAAQNGKLDVVDFLLKQGALVNERSKSGKTALGMADGEKIKQLLKRYGGKV